MTDTDTTRAPGPQRAREGTVVLIAVALASLMVPLAVTGPALALTSMTADLAAGVQGGQWVLNAYNVTFAASLLAAGGVADRMGRRRVLVAGTVVYAAMSLITALSTNILVVDLARAVQGIGSAGILTAGAAILAATFDGPARARAFGVLGTAFGAGLALGPLLAGALVDLAGWRSVFLLNLVIAAVVLALSPRVPESRTPTAGPRRLGRRRHVQRRPVPAGLRLRAGPGVGLGIAADRRRLRGGGPARRPVRRGRAARGEPDVRPLAVPQAGVRRRDVPAVHDRVRVRHPGRVPAHLPAGRRRVQRRRRRARCCCR